MRKLRRSIYRAYAEQKGLKASKFVHDSWEYYQIKRRGYSARRANIRHGTKPKRKWRAA